MNSTTTWGHASGTWHTIMPATTSACGSTAAFKYLCCWFPFRYLPFLNFIAAFSLSMQVVMAIKLHKELMGGVYTGINTQYISLSSKMVKFNSYDCWEFR